MMGEKVKANAGGRRRARLLGSCGVVLAMVPVMAFSAGSVAQGVKNPGERPADRPELAARELQVTADEGPSGLGVVVDERGRLTHSVDATGTLAASSIASLLKPAGASLRRASLFVASTGFVGPAAGSVSIDGITVPLGTGVPSFIQSENYFVDVTEALRAKIDSAPPGAIEFTIGETASPSIDGSILSLIFDDPAVENDRSVALLFGATQTAGDQFELQLARPIDPSSSDALMSMSLGISYGFQDTVQFSTVDVNGQRLTTSAGGQDDGEPADGALITVGGVGDSPGNPPDPFAGPANERSDDELYDLLPFVSSGDESVVIDTANPSNDDNILFAAFVTNPPVTSIITPNPTVEIDLVALGDSFSSGEGTFNYDEHIEAQECHRGPDAWPRYLEQGTSEIPRIEHKACTGARVPQLFENYKSDPPQINYGEPNSDVELVTLTIGGNDVGFSGIISECYRTFESCADVPESKNFQKKLTQLGQRLESFVYPLIRQAYPKARIVHIGYPQIVPAPGVTPVDCGWLSYPEQEAAVEILGDLNFAIRTAVFAYDDDRVEYFGIDDALQGHELCTSDPWVHPVRGPSAPARPFGGTQQGHPTAPGQNAMATAVAIALGYAYTPQTGGGW